MPAENFTSGFEIALPVTNPCSFPNAIMLPEKVTAPMSVPAMIDTPESMASVSAPPAPPVPPATRRYSPTATRPDAAPPKPLKTATISGMAVIFTVRAMTAPISPPTATPTMIHV